MAATAVPLIPDHSVLRIIGRGSFGEIWLARSLTGAFRAVKVVYRASFESERSFAREFEGMSSFEPISRDHEGFVDILHVGRSDGFFYYIMELADDDATGLPAAADGIDAYSPKTLKTELDRRKRLPVAECVHLGASLAEALDDLHSHRLTHRDIKPANIIFVEGQPKLADIGLVASVGQRSYVGTEGYVPPEGPGSPGADIYSVGKVLYEIAMGKDRLDFPELSTQLDEDPERKLLLAFNQILLKACAPQPAARYRNAREILADLLDLEEGWRPRRRVPWVILSVVLVLLLAAAGLFAWLARSIPKKEALSTLRIETDPPGAIVLFGDRMQKSPASFDSIEPGQYPLRIMLAGYEPLEMKIDAAAQPSPFHLRRSKGSLFLTAEPPNGPVEYYLLDGLHRLHGLLPATISGLPVGVYDVAARRGGRTVHQSAQVFREQETPVVLVFENGSVKITSAPGGAAVLRDGAELGRTPLLIDEVSPGPVTFQLHLEGYMPASVSGTVPSRGQVFLASRLERKRGPEPGQPWQNSLGLRFLPLGPVDLSIWDTRVSDYAAFCSATARQLPKLDFEQSPTHPAVQVSWDDAKAFCKWLTEKEVREGILQEGQYYRLPTDEEWSAASGLPPEGGSTPEERDGKHRGEYPWGRAWPPPTGSGNFGIAGRNDGWPQTSPAGSFPPNRLGFYDMSGNVWQWIEEGYSGKSRDWGVLRGGSWGTAKRSELETSYRNVVDRGERDVIYGFRCVLVPQAGL